MGTPNKTTQLRDQTQQDFLFSAKSTLKVTWDGLAALSGIEPLALKHYRMPESSKAFRPMPEVAWRVVQLLLEQHLQKSVDEC